MFAISIVIAIIFKTGVVPSLIIIFILTLLYTLEGGLTAVIWTDVIQLTIYVAGTVMALFVALHTLPGDGARSCAWRIWVRTSSPFSIFALTGVSPTCSGLGLWAACS